LNNTAPLAASTRHTARKPNFISDLAFKADEFRRADHRGKRRLHGDISGQVSAARLWRSRLGWCRGGRRDAGTRPALLARFERPPTVDRCLQALVGFIDQLAILASRCCMSSALSLYIDSGR
jgi:hypothetical protein